MHETLPKKLSKLNIDSPTARSKEIMSLSQGEGLNKSSHPDLSAAVTPRANPPKPKKRINLLETINSAYIPTPVEPTSPMLLDVRPRIKPLQESKEKYILPENWETTKFDDPVYQAWRNAMIKSLSEQPDLLSVSPKLFRELIQADFMN